ncbi:hypothetical protein [Burkholderia ubonensis]|uniref:Endonuclease/exonuclease/phosphatase domain-containing protein n=1 Tax=Burkholderia ubonensis TaxID=101571 RepID=A0A119MID9_9BURK|nr:hypothetical protein [Burkholderia ubonensis]AOK61846.1 hypothetical protein WM29_22150 [Burkholderia ubonensis]KWD77589.1 hypothetical protein WL71_27310 [Burkholderia ubonensis]KWD82455.1 hypothetical protein WL70_16365 [Burkholderia ubonensis]KWD95496.1 hypothetical protein WL73_02260 [Burkholderia ubonensis]KWD95882.1 hypothetical protein WL72_22725 [Burkholderia ubonensis]
MKIFYMNQGGGGHWGAVPYSEFDLVLLAESPKSAKSADLRDAKQGFALNWSGGNPLMSVQQKANLGRIISGITDLDVSAQQVRPLVTFKICGDDVRVVFVHLKSGNVRYATDALNAAVSAIIDKGQFGHQGTQKTLWIGDFNRANDSELIRRCDARVLFAGGGHHEWDLDRVYASGDWAGYKCTVEPQSFSGADHNHIGVGISIDRTG